MAQAAVTLLERIRKFAIVSDVPATYHGTYLRQVGEMRMSPADPWLSFKAEQTLSAAGVDFRWTARAHVARWLPATIVDAVASNRGILCVRVFGMFPVARFKGPRLDKGEIMRGLAEMPWRPTGFIDQPNLSWTTAAENLLTATFDDGRIRATVNCKIAGNGRVLAVNAPDRPRTVGKQIVETPWSGVFADYQEFNGIRVPTRAEVTWHLPEGPFPCWRAHVTEFGFV